MIKDRNTIITILVYLLFPILNYISIKNLIGNEDVFLIHISNATIVFALVIYLALNDLLIWIAGKLLSQKGGKLLAGIFIFSSLVLNLVFIFFFLLILNNSFSVVHLKYYLIPIAFLGHAIYILWKYKLIRTKAMN